MQIAYAPVSCLGLWKAHRLASYISHGHYLTNQVRWCMYLGSLQRVNAFSLNDYCIK